MTKLTNYARECIAKRAIAFAFVAKQAAQKAEADALAREVHAAIFTADELKLVAKLPAKWIRCDGCIRFNCAGMSATLIVNGGLPVPYSRYCDRIGSIEAGDLADRVMAHIKDVEAVKTAKAAAYKQTLAMLGGVTTIKRLRDVWPDGAQFYANYSDNQPPAQLPAVLVEDVNAMLGLPVSA